MYMSLGLLSYYTKLFHVKQTNGSLFVDKRLCQWFIGFFIIVYNQRGGRRPPLCIPSHARETLAAPLRGLRAQDSATCGCDNAADYLSRAKAYDNLNFSHITSSTAFGGPPSPEGKARVREYVCDVCP